MKSAVDDLVELSARDGIVLLADVRFLTAEEGGRTKPAGPGYWATVWGGGGKFNYMFSFQLYRPAGTIVRNDEIFVFRQRERLLLRSLVRATEVPPWMSKTGALLILSEDPRHAVAVADVVGAVRLEGTK